MEVWLKEKNSGDKLVRRQIVKTRKFLISDVLKKRKSVANNNRFLLNISYHPLLLKLKNVLSEIYLLLTPDREHGKIFERIPIVGFRRAKRLKGILVRVKVAPLDKKKGSINSCEGIRCEICAHVVTSETFRSCSTQREYCINPDNLNCCSTMLCIFFDAKDVLRIHR